MIFVENLNTNPYMNHALEEWLMDNLDDDCFMLWRNQTAILLGKNQNAYREVNLNYARNMNFKIVRRITGGGTVFTDSGNIMFTYISNDVKNGYNNFKKFAHPILKALHSLGIPAEFSGRNDLIINGKKFCGNAQCRYKEKVLHHGTLMYQASTSQLAKALNVRKVKLHSKGVESVKSRVTNISEYMKEPMDIEEFRSYVYNHVLKNTPDSFEYKLSEEQWDQVREISKNHENPTWIYGKNPEYNTVKEIKLPAGLVETYLDVKNGIIERACIMGDFFSDGELEDIENALIGVPYTEDDIKYVIGKFSVHEYMHNINDQELVHALI